MKLYKIFRLSNSTMIIHRGKVYIRYCIPLNNGDDIYLVYHKVYVGPIHLDYKLKMIAANLYSSIELFNVVMDYNSDHLKVKKVKF